MRLVGKIIVDLSQFNLSNVLAERLNALLDLRALSPIQSLYLARRDEPKDFVLLSLEGEGKTTAAMVAAIELLVKNRASAEASPAQGPRVVFFSSSRQHAEKLKKTFDAIASPLGFAAFLLHDAWKANVRLQKLVEAQPEVVIGTPAVIRSTYEKAGLTLESVPLGVFCSLEKICQNRLADEAREFCETVHVERKLFLASEAGTAIETFARSVGVDVEILTAAPSGSKSVVCERFMVVSAYRRNKLVPYMFDKGWSGYSRTLIVVNSSQNLPKVKKLLAEGEIRAAVQYPEGAAYYEPVDPTAFGAEGRHFVVTMSNAIPLFEGCGIDSVVFYDFPASPRAYLNALKIIEVNPAAVPQFGALFSFVQPGDMGRVLKTAEIIGRSWVFANPFGLAVPVADELIETAEMRAAQIADCEQQAATLAAAMKSPDETPLANKSAPATAKPKRTRKKAVVSDLIGKVEGVAASNEEAVPKKRTRKKKVDPVEPVSVQTDDLTGVVASLAEFVQSDAPARSDSVASLAVSQEPSEKTREALFDDKDVEALVRAEDWQQGDASKGDDLGQSLEENEDIFGKALNADEANVGYDDFDEYDEGDEETALDVVEDESEGAEEGAVAVPGASEAAAPRRTLTIRSGYVPKPHVDNEITITEPLSSNTVELRAAQARERRAMRGTNEPLTHQTVGKNGRRRFVKKSAANTARLPAFSESDDSILGFMASKKPGSAKGAGKKNGAVRKGKDAFGSTAGKLNGKRRRNANNAEQPQDNALVPAAKPRKEKVRVGQKKNNRPLKHVGPKPKPVQQVVSKAAMASSEYSPEALDELSDAMTAPMVPAAVTASASKPKSTDKKAGSTLRTPRTQRLKHLRKLRESAAEKNGKNDRAESATNPLEKTDALEKPPVPERTNDRATDPAGAVPSGEKLKRQDGKPGAQRKHFKFKNKFKNQSKREQVASVDEDNFGNSIHYKPKKPSGKTDFSLPASAWQPADPFDYRSATLSLPQTMPMRDNLGFHTVFGATSQPDNRVPNRMRAGKGKGKNPQGFKGNKFAGRQRGKNGGKN